MSRKVIAVLLAAAGATILAAAISVPGIRVQLKASPMLQGLNTPLARSVDAFLFNLRHPAPPPVRAGDRGPADRLALAHPVGLVEDGAGNVYISDRGLAAGGRFIWKVAPDGTACVIAGNGRRGVPRSGAPARDVALGTPQGLAIDPEGRLHVADSYNHMVLRIEPDGRIARVAGIGRPGSRGDGGPAERAALNQPYDVRFDAEGALYIADYGNHRIRKVTPDGRIHTVAGTGEPGYAGDHGPATAALLRGPYGVFAAADGSLWIADSENHVVRRVDEDGIIRTVAGTGQRGYGGDGGPAPKATFDSPQAVAVVGTRVYVNDEHNHAIRVIELDGTIRTLVGTGVRGTDGDGRPAARARLDDPENLLVRSDGSILITERGRVRAVSPRGTVRTFAGGPTRKES